MNSDKKIRNSQNRAIKVYTKRPQAGLISIKGSARIEDGLSCTFTQGEHQLVMDMPEILGGDATGPTPGLYARASVSGCVAIGIKQLAARRGLAFKSVSVDIETDFDDAASLGVSDAYAGPLETRLAIHIETEADESEVVAIVNEAMEKDPYYLALRDAQQVKIGITTQDK